jgi:hypothetical protein
VANGQRHVEVPGGGGTRGTEIRGTDKLRTLPWSRMHTHIQLVSRMLLQSYII